MTVGALIGSARREAPASFVALLVGSALVVAAVFLQASVVQDVEILRATPDLVVIVVAGIGILRGPVPGAAAGFAGGLGVDLLGLGVVGSTSIALVLAGYCSGLAGERMPRRAVVRPLLIVGLASLGAGVVELLVAALVGAAPSDPVAALTAIVASALVDVAVAIPVLPLVRRLLRPPARRQLLTATLAPAAAAEIAAELAGPPAIVLAAERSERVTVPEPPERDAS